MNESRLYEGRIVHARFAPRKHRFSYGAFLFALDLDEIDALTKRIPWLSRNRFNLYSYFDCDHIGSERVQAMLRSSGIDEPIAKVVLVTNLRILGYVFNPVSFYYCFSAAGEPLGAVAEVNNTFGDRKTYILTERRGSSLVAVHAKDFYISPFIARDATLDLRLRLPDDRLVIAMHDFEKGRHVLTATVAADARPLTAPRLLWMTFRYPLLTLKVIAAIHWEALRLWLKKIPWWRYA